MRWRGQGWRGGVRTGLTARPHLAVAAAAWVLAGGCAAGTAGRGLVELTLSGVSADASDADTLLGRLRRPQPADAFAGARFASEARDGDALVIYALLDRRAPCDPRRLGAFADAMAEALASPVDFGFHAVVSGSHEAVWEMVRAWPEVERLEVPWEGRGRPGEEPGDTGGATLPRVACAAVRDRLAALPVPDGLRLVPERVLPGPWDDGEVESCKLWIVEAQPMVGASHVAQAEVAYEEHYRPGTPYVGLTFDDEGRRRFAEGTARIVGQVLAIVHEGLVTSAPIVQESIPGGEARITLGNAPLVVQAKEARDLVASIRAGALSAHLRVTQRRSVCVP